MSGTLSWIQNFGEDLRFGARQFRRAPGYAVFTVLVLALGTGTVTAMFTISYGVLLKPLPFRADRQLYEAVEKTAKGEEDFTASYREVTAWQEATKDSAEVAFAWGGLQILDAPTGAEIISEVAASPNLFSVLGVEPVMGRAFLSGEQISDHPDLVILSYEMWAKRYTSAAYCIP